MEFKRRKLYHDFQVRVHQCYFNTLPDELILWTLCLIGPDLQTLTSFRQVSQRALRLVDSNDIWKRLFVARWGVDWLSADALSNAEFVWKEYFIHHYKLSKNFLSDDFGLDCLKTADVLVPIEGMFANQVTVLKDPVETGSNCEVWVKDKNLLNNNNVTSTSPANVATTNNNNSSSNNSNNIINNNSNSESVNSNNITPPYRGIPPDVRSISIPKHALRPIFRTEPKPPKTSFMFYMSEKYQQLSSHMTGFFEIAERLATMWNNTSEEEKLKFREKAERDGENYKRKLLLFFPLHPTSSPNAFHMHAQFVPTQLPNQLHVLFRRVGGDPKFPRRPTSAFGFYVAEQRSDPQVTFTTSTVRALSEHWRTLPEADKQKYEQMNKQDRERFQIELLEYEHQVAQKNAGSNTTSENNNNDDNSNINDNNNNNGGNNNDNNDNVVHRGPIFNFL